ncbi:MAG: dTDP-4-dehydrorhamnose reductase [Solirubrobacteraceae bacterium]
MRLLVAGAAGMLGQDVARAGERAGHELVLVSHAELDIRDAASIADAFDSGKPDAVLNCAAWTDVDGAEAHRDQAHAVNALGAGRLARAAAQHGVPLLHVSTDYVFSGDAPLDEQGSPRPYAESDPTGPRTVYGQTKLEGEQEVLAASPEHTVVRTAWLFGTGGSNFADTMLRLACERDEVSVVVDQTGCPTWTGHLAPALIGLLEREVRGLVHLAGGGSVSWNGFAREIFRQAECDCRVLQATTAEMARPAPRPAWSALASERADVLPMPDWRDGLGGYLAARDGMMRA